MHAGHVANPQHREQAEAIEKVGGDGVAYIPTHAYVIVTCPYTDI